MAGSLGVGGGLGGMSTSSRSMLTRRATTNPTRTYFPSYDATVVYVGAQTTARVVPMATQYQYLIATLITTGIGLGVWIYYELSSTQATSEQTQTAERLNAKIRRITDVQTELDKNPGYLYFVHGSQTLKWKNINSIGFSFSQQRANTDFGRWFL
jgi:hypothetical protein